MILLRYLTPLDQVDAQMAAHVAWLEKGYDAGIFIVSGRRAPRTGGVILARGHRSDIEALMADDPFLISGVAEAEVFEFGANMAADRFAALLT